MPTGAKGFCSRRRREAARLHLRVNVNDRGQVLYDPRRHAPRLHDLHDGRRITMCRPRAQQVIQRIGVA